MPLDSLSTQWLASSGRSALTPLDEAVEYVATRASRALPAYLLAMAPYSAAMLFLIDGVCSQHRSGIPLWCGLLTLATMWRWLGLAFVQRQVQKDVRGEAARLTAKRLLKILLLRIWANFALLWGGLLIVPAFYGFFLAGFAAPLIVETESGLAMPVIRTFQWITRAFNRLSLLSLSFGVGVLVLAASVFIGQSLIVFLIPTFFGLPVADFALTLGSWPWTLCLAYFIFIIVDFYWTVAAVLVFYDLQARRLGGDLRLRLQLLQRGAS